MITPSKANTLTTSAISTIQSIRHYSSKETLISVSLNALANHGANLLTTARIKTIPIAT